MNPYTTLFLCTGNYYRSRFAEAYFNHLAVRRSLTCRAESRGLRVDVEQKHNVGPISVNAAEALDRLGVTLGPNPRMPRDLTAADLESAQVVIALKEAEHRPMMAERFPAWEARAVYWHVDDVPPSYEYDPMAHIASLVGDLVEELARGQDAHTAA